MKQLDTAFALFKMNGQLREHFLLLDMMRVFSETVVHTAATLTNMQKFAHTESILKDHLYAVALARPYRPGDCWDII